jgi:two-component system, NtrC family, sensor kinase
MGAMSLMVANPAIDVKVRSGNVVSPRRLERQRILEGLLQIGHFVGSVMLLDDILDRIVKITGDLMNVPVCSIYLLDEAKEQLVLRSNMGLEPSLRGSASFAIGQGIAGWVVEHGEVVSLEDANLDPRYQPLPSILAMGCKACLCVPLRIQEEIIGAMIARTRQLHRFEPQEILLFETIGKQVAIVIEKARMYEKQLQAERLAAVAVSLSGVAHYIKNVLMMMQGGEYLVDRGLKQGDLVRVGEGWDVLQRSSVKIRSLVENILNYCRKEETHREPVPLNRMVLELFQSMEAVARERGIILQPELDDTVGEVRVDPESLHDALLNLVTNGMEAIPEGQAGRVQVRTSRLSDRNQICIEVSDTGGGVPPEHRDQIFNLFFTTKGKKGTGIGLAATRKIIEEHGGSIELDAALDHGAHFLVYLPIYSVAK